MRVPFLLMAVGAPGMLVAAAVNRSDWTATDNVEATSLLLFIACGMLFFTGWLLAVREVQRRERARKQSKGDRS